MTRLCAAVASALVLAACGQRSVQTPAAPTPPGASPAVSGATVTDPKAVPTAFQGVWAATEEDCARASETRLTVTAVSLAFSESRGRVSRVDQMGPEEILIHVPLRSEGENSERTFRYRLINGGTGLFDVRSGLARIRCPGA